MILNWKYPIDRAYAKLGHFWTTQYTEPIKDREVKTDEYSSYMYVRDDLWPIPIAKCLIPTATGDFRRP